MHIDFLAKGAVLCSTAYVMLAESWRRANSDCCRPTWGCLKAERPGGMEMPHAETEALSEKFEVFL